ncbi:hypothetical protein ACFU0X_20460 [Streptomyces cellulosae]|uniref:Uncharacterized protein n=1 Tax=Streptomyces cellulosae TaxID=1968 RepID=A0ABW6JK75_STRCE
MSKRAYEIYTVNGEVVDSRSDGKTADALAQRLADETGVAHVVYTPTGRVRLEVFPAVEVEAGEVAGIGQATPYSVVYARMTDGTEAEQAEARAEWERRLEVYKEASRAKDPSERIVGPKMAVALELGAIDDGRTRAALIRRGLAQAGEGEMLIVSEAGHKALKAALVAVA